MAAAVRQLPLTKASGDDDPSSNAALVGAGAETTPFSPPLSISWTAPAPMSPPMTPLTTAATAIVRKRIVNLLLPPYVLTKCNVLPPAAPHRPGDSLSFHVNLPLVLVERKQRRLKVV